jgi:predicted chitinase
MSDFKIEFNFTEQMVRDSIPEYRGDYTGLYEIFLGIFPKYRISNEERVAGFLEQVGYRSNNFANVQALRPINDSMLRQFATFNKMPAAEANKYCDTLKGAIDSAGWFWNIKYLNNVADNFDFKNLTERVNSGSDITERKENFYRIYSVLQKGL